MSELIRTLENHAADPNKFLNKDEVKDVHVNEAVNAVKIKTEADLRALKLQLTSYRTKVNMAKFDTTRTISPVELTPEHEDEVNKALDKIDAAADEKLRAPGAPPVAPTVPGAPAPAPGAPPARTESKTSELIRRGKEMFSGAMEASKTGIGDGFDYVLRKGGELFDWVRENFGKTIKSLKKSGLIQNQLDFLIPPPAQITQVKKAMEKQMPKISMEWGDNAEAQAKDILNIMRASGQSSDDFFKKIVEASKATASDPALRSDDELLTAAKKLFPAAVPPATPPVTPPEYPEKAADDAFIKTMPVVEACINLLRDPAATSISIEGGLTALETQIDAIKIKLSNPGKERLKATLQKNIYRGDLAGIKTRLEVIKTKLA